jgi:hypothetical protein
MERRNSLKFQEGAQSSSDARTPINTERRFTRMATRSGGEYSRTENALRKKILIGKVSVQLNTYFCTISTI